jgi:lysozyme
MSIFKSFFDKFKKPAATPTPVAATPPPAPPVQPSPGPTTTTPLPAQISIATKVSQAGVDIIKGFEGCELHAYPDPGTGGDPWTIGYGHTGPEVKKGLKITKEEAEALLKKDLVKFEQGVLNLCTVQLTQPQFDALVSFAYNCGLGNLKSSTLLKLVNKGDFQGAAEQFLRWNKAAGKVLKGLTRRREAEKQVFLCGIYDTEELRRLVAELILK